MRHNRMRDDGDSPSRPLEFELTEIADARAALDGLPNGAPVTGFSTEPDWRTLRRRTKRTDVALTPFALDWLYTLPEEIRPRVMAEEYPRIVNELAAAWTDPVAKGELLDSLLKDGRGNRSGFPAAVWREIEVLIDDATRV